MTPDIAKQWVQALFPQKNTPDGQAEEAGLDIMGALQSLQKAAPAQDADYAAAVDKIVNAVTIVKNDLHILSTHNYDTVDAGSGEYTYNSTADRFLEHMGKHADKLRESIYAIEGRAPADAVEAVKAFQQQLRAKHVSAERELAAVPVGYSR